MRGFTYAVFLLALNLNQLNAQDRGGLAGSVKDTDGGVVSNVAVRAKNAATGAISSTFTSSKGSFEFPPIAAGNYELTIPRIGFTFDPFSQRTSS